MRRRNNTTNRNDCDDRCAIEKITAGDASSLDAADCGEMIEGAAGFIPGPVIGQAASIGLSPFVGSMQADRDYKKLSKKLHLNLETEASHSIGIRDKLRELNSRWKERLKTAAVSAAGGGVGWWAGAALGSFIPIPGAAFVGGMLGGLGGGTLAYKGYNKMWPSRNQDAATLTTMLYEAQQRGEKFTPEMPFVAMALASNISEKKKQEVVDAWEAGNTRKLATQMLEMDIDLAAYTGLRSSVEKTVAEQCADLLNQGMDARALLYKGLQLPGGHPAYSQALSPLPPVTPGMYSARPGGHRTYQTT